MHDDQVAEAFRAAMRLEKGFVLRDDMSFDHVPGWDSIGHMNLVLELEKRFATVLDMDQIVAMDSVGAVRDVVARKQAGKS
ncbi:MAG: acyl carrier protein [Thermoguttaceae bacterium]|jgi:acyl carrier protein